MSSSISPPAATGRHDPVLRRVMACLLFAGVLAAGCSKEDPPRFPAQPAKTSADSGAISSPRPASDVLPTPRSVLESAQWPSARVGDGEALISCSADYAAGDGIPLVDLGYFSVLDAMAPCREKGLLRLHYRGKIDAGFADLIERVGAMAERMGIGKRILDLDSAGGQVEDAIRAGDVVGGAHWTLWVREGAICHSACVLILAAGDQRLISGEVGIHRMIRMSSSATTRGELNKELREVQGQLNDYLERNGAAQAITDLMMTVPSRELRLLTPEELRSFGLSGANAVQQDLERIALLRRCGEDFVRRREGFLRQFDETCAREGEQVDAMNACGLRLRKRFGFPDKTCPDDTPMAAVEADRSLQ